MFLLVSVQILKVSVPVVYEIYRQTVKAQSLRKSKVGGERRAKTQKTDPEYSEASDEVFFTNSFPP